MTNYWDGIAVIWGKTPLQTLWRMHSDAVNMRLFARWLPTMTPVRLLKTDLFDEAYSDGLYPLLASRAKTVIGIDVAVLTLGAATARHPGLQAVGADVRLLPFVTGNFDVIVSNSTLDHFATQDDITRSIHELHRVLKKGGHLLITLDNLANPVIGLRNMLPFSLLSSLGLLPYYMGTSCRPQQLRRILQDVGFEILEVQAVMHCPRIFAVAIARILSKYAGAGTQKKFLRILMSFERLAVLPTRFLSGNFVAVKAMKIT